MSDLQSAINTACREWEQNNSMLEINGSTLAMAQREVSAAVGAPVVVVVERWHLYGYPMPMPVLDDETRAVVADLCESCGALTFAAWLRSG